MSVERLQIDENYSIARVLNGCWQLSQGHSLDGPIDFNDVKKAFYELVDAGFTTFDCADIYTGAEEFIGEFIKEKKQDPNFSEDMIQVHTS